LLENESARDFIPEGLKNKVEAAYKNAFTTEASCLAVVQQSGMALRFVPEEFKTESVCLAAVQKHGNSLEYVPVEKRTEAVCIDAVRNGLYIGPDHRYTPSKWGLIPAELQGKVKETLNLHEKHPWL